MLNSQKRSPSLDRNYYGVNNYSKSTSLAQNTSPFHFKHSEEQYNRLMSENHKNLSNLSKPCISKKQNVPIYHSRERDISNIGTYYCKFDCSQRSNRLNANYHPTIPKIKSALNIPVSSRPNSTDVYDCQAVTASLPTYNHHILNQQKLRNLDLHDNYTEKIANNASNVYQNGQNQYYPIQKSSFEKLLNSNDQYTNRSLKSTSSVCDEFPLNVNNASTVAYESKNHMSDSHRPSDFQGLVGLNNLGNTCFMNSVIQCLSNTKMLVHVCLNDSYIPDLNKNSSMHGTLFSSYSELMKKMWSCADGRSSHVSPQQFKCQIQKFAPRFMGYSQQDAQEFLRYLLQGLHEDVNRIRIRPKTTIPNYDEEDKLPGIEKAELYWQRYKSVDNSIIADLFMGQLMSTLECTSCFHKSTTFDPFWDLSLPIPKNNLVSIKDCLDLFTSKETLEGAEQPMCSGCKTRQRCRKSFSIQRFPQILVIHFKRFSGERYRSKLTNFIDYPLEDLNLRNYASKISTPESTSYRLYGVSNHSGSVYGGHYTAYCRHPNSGTWFEYNDTRVRQISASDVVSPEGYVLFYEKKKSNHRM